MSLLMEALKKAEEAKRHTDQQEQTLAPAASLAEATLTPSVGKGANNTANPLPELSLHLEAVDAELATLPETPTAKSAPPPTRGPNDPSFERAAARNVFAAKDDARPRNALWLFVGIGLLAIVGIGAYFWWQLRSIQSPSLVSAPRATPPTQITSPAPALDTTPAPPPPPARSAAPSTAATSPEGTATPGTPTTSTTPRAAGPAVEAPPRPATENPVFSRPSPSTSSTTRPSAVAPPAAPRAENNDPTLRLTRNASRVPATLQRAYEALQAGRDDDAQRAYEQVLKTDGRNTDALLGLATLAARQGQASTAHAYYLRVLEIDPNDATARAGILGATRQGEGEEAESRLKTALSGQPNSPSLLFALGNLYARQQRWSEAQQAYFQAYAGEPDNPDIIFNLAVSLDHLHQGKLAAQYYQMALDAGNNRATAFNRDQVNARLRELRQP